MEVEYLPFSPDLQRVHYFGPGGIGVLLKGLVVGGATTEKEFRGNLLAVNTPEGCVNLESGSQIEFSSLPADDVHGLAAMWDRHVTAILTASKPYGHRFVPMGYDPVCSIDDISWIPNRGNVERHLQAHGPVAMSTGKMTASVHVSLDYESPEDAIDLMRTGFMVTPFVASLFASSPLKERRSRGYLSERARTWIDSEDQRSAAFLELLIRPHTILDQARELARLPLMWCPDPEGESVAGAGRTLEQLLEFWGVTEPTPSQLVACTTQVWTDARLKSVVELRGVDCPEQALTLAVPALWVGLMYDDESRRLAGERIERVARQAPNYAAILATDGLNAELAGRPARAVVRELIELARAGLRRRGRLDASGQDETGYLDPLEAVMARGTSTAQHIIDMAIGGHIDYHQLFNAICYREVPPRLLSRPQLEMAFSMLSVEFEAVNSPDEIRAAESIAGVHLVRVSDPTPHQVSVLKPFGYVHKPCRIGYQLSLPELRTDQGPLETYLSILNAEGRRKVRLAVKHVSERIARGEISVIWGGRDEETLFEQFVDMHTQTMLRIPRGRPLLAQSVGDAGAAWLGDDKRVLYVRGSSGLLAGAVVRDEGDRHSIMFTASHIAEKQRNADVQVFIVWLLVKRCLEEGRPLAAYGSDPNLYGHEVGIGLLRFKSVLGFRPSARTRSELLKIVDLGGFTPPVVMFEYGGAERLVGLVLSADEDPPHVAGLSSLVEELLTIRITSSPWTPARHPGGSAN